MKLRWFTNVKLLSFDIGSMTVRLELERKATYLGLWWHTKRNRLHIYLAFMVMLQLHLIIPQRGRRVATEDVSADSSTDTPESAKQPLPW